MCFSARYPLVCMPESKRHSKPLPVESADSQHFSPLTVSRQFSNTLINSMNSLYCTSTVHLHEIKKKETNNIQKAHNSKDNTNFTKTCRKTHHSVRTSTAMNHVSSVKQSLLLSLTCFYQSRHIAVTNFVKMMYTRKCPLCTSSRNDLES